MTSRHCNTSQHAHTAIHRNTATHCTTHCNTDGISTVQHTATPRNTPQHTAKTHRKKDGIPTLQHTATHRKHTQEYGRHFDSASVMFVAVCLTESRTEDDDPTVVVSELNRVFSLLDSIMELHPACYKVCGSLCVAVCCGGLWWVAVCVAVCCGVLRCVAGCG